MSVGPTEKIIERPINPEFYRIMTKRLHYLSVFTVGQTDRLIDLLGERILLFYYSSDQSATDQRTLLHFVVINILRLIHLDFLI